LGTGEGPERIRSGPSPVFLRRAGFSGLQRTGGDIADELLLPRMKITTSGIVERSVPAITVAKSV